LRLSGFVATAVVLLLLLTWLLLRGMNTGTTALDDGLRAMDDFAIAESALHKDVLSARVGMLRNYDPLVHELETLRSSIERLRLSTPQDHELEASVESLNQLVGSEERSTEQFKTNNALLQNSLAYFELFSARLAAQEPGSVLVRQASDLSTALLHLTLDTSPTAAADVDDRLAKFSVSGLSEVQATVVDSLLAHARMLRALLPETDQTVRVLFALPTEHAEDVVRELLKTRKGAAKSRAELYRFTLYAVSLLLVGLLIRLGMRLQSRALILSRRAGIEHIIAGISTRFINSRPHETAAHVEQALADLAQWNCADRAYFVVAGAPAKVYKWSREGVNFEPGWPESAPDVAAHFEPAAAGPIQVYDVRKTTPTEATNLLRKADIHSWLCIPATCEQRVRAVLGFDAVRRAPADRWCEFAMLRMAFDAIANALDREALERDRERLQENLQHARRMETIGAFASGIAHNFNNIIGAILGYAETAQTYVRPGSRPVESLVEIRRAGERARDLVHQILTFGRRSDARRSRVCINSLVTEAKSLLDVSLSPYVNVVVRTTTENTTVLGEHALLQQVILNVCNNAAQAIDAPGPIEIDVDVQNVPDSLQLEHGELMPGRHVVISVIDLGRGMDEMTRERMFEPFFSTRVGGNGLGLATVREIVLQHGGALQVRSTPGAGTQFDIWLPCASAIEVSPSEEPHDASGRGTGETVLVLESDRARLLRHEEILAALGYEPVGFTNLIDAINACRTTPMRFDAAVLCCHLHGGPALIKDATEIRAAAPTLPLILATISAREIAAPALAGAGISGIIRHPLTSAELAGALSTCLLPK
jgi:signal transduction histidine kinase